MVLAVAAGMLGLPHHNVYADGEMMGLSPAKQLKAGVSPENVICNGERVLLLKADGKPICVYPASVERFVSVYLATVVERETSMAAPVDRDEMTEMEEEEQSMETSSESMRLLDQDGMDEEQQSMETSSESMRLLDKNEMTRMQDSGLIVSMTAFTDRFAEMKEGVMVIVNEGIAAYEEQGESMLETITAGAETYNPETPYLFVIDLETMTTQAHGSMPERVGTVATPLESGKKTFEDIREDLRSENKTWVKYTFVNPATGENQTKKSYMALHENLIFGSGFYLNDLEANMMTAKWKADSAAMMYDENGTDSFEAINEAAADYMAGESYPFVADMRTLRLVAHGANADLVGNESVVASGNADKSLEQIQSESGIHGGTWASYMFENFETEMEETKLSWLTVRDDYMFGAGFYPDEYATKKINAMMSVDRALSMYAENGSDAFADITALNVTEEWYPFVMDTETRVELADGSVLDRSGQVIWSMQELNAAIGDVKDVLESGQGAFITYVFLNPETDEQQAKKSWVVLHDGYLFGAGMYLTGQWAGKAEAKWSVATTIEMYKELGAEETFAAVNAMNSTQESYPFVLNSELVSVANGADSGHVGERLSDLVMPDKDSEQIMAELNDIMAESWISYTFVNPSTGEDEEKTSLLRMYDGYVFGAGYYHHDDDKSDPAAR